jgi:hypothetical protein
MRSIVDFVLSRNCAESVLATGMQEHAIATSPPARQR